MQTAIGLPELVLVPPCDFSVRMHKHWTETLNMPAPPALMDVQRLMAEEFQRLIINNSTDTAVSSSVVLPLPTGAGKTQGTCVYASMQAELNALALTGDRMPVGIVIITRLIEDADGIAKQVNELSGRTVAVAHHTKNKADTADVFNSDVLVICHQAFLNAAKAWSVHDRERWHRISQWRGGDRLLFIIDEALANVVEHHKATAKNLAMAVQSIPHELRLRFPVVIRTLENIKRWLEAKEAGVTDDNTQLLWGEGSENISRELRLLREALSGVDFDPSLYKEDARSLVEEILRDVEVMCASFAYYFKSGDQHSINSAAHLLPPGLPGAVVLDATAENDTLYQLLGLHIVDVPPNVRNYSNVTLHVARTASGLGKESSGKTKHLRLPRLAKRLSDEIAPGRSVFLCVHMHSAALAETFSTEALKLNVGYWGAIDGKNTWKDCDVAVIFGLPYMDQRRAINTLFATHGPQDTAWLQANTNKQQANLLTVIMQRHLATSVVQAINRICCRRVIDEQGRCPVADVYILLPKHWQGHATLCDIQGNMPGINVVSWDYEPDGPKVYAPRSSSASAAIISLMRQQEAGMTPFPFIQRQLSLTKRQVSRIKEQLLNGESNIAKALREIGVSYHAGVGRGSKSYLVKA